MNKEFFPQLFVMFFVSILSLSLIGLVVGDGAKEYSSLFSLGSDGISFVSIFQMLFYSILISLLKILLFSETIFKKMMARWRAVLLVLGSFLLAVIFIFSFHWFPYNYYPAWIGFFASFTAGFLVSLAVMLIKGRMDTRKYEDLLSRYKEEKRNEEK